MLNKILNTLSSIPINNGLKKYQYFPPNQTALLLINCQKGFLHDQSDFKNKLEKLIAFSRSNKWKIIHAPFRYTERRFPSPVQLLMDKKLKASPANNDLLYVEKEDLILPDRSSLSAFSETNLEEVLRQNGLEHLVLVGPLANFTLDSTMRDGVQKDFHVAIVTDVLALLGQDQDIHAYKSTLSKYAQTVTDLKGLKRLSEKSKNLKE